MSNKKKKYLKILTIVLVVAVGLHFVPVYSQKGDLHSMPEVCIGTAGPVDYNAFENDNYRLVLGGLLGFIHDRRDFVARNSNNSNYDGCAPHVHLRLYIF